MTYGSLRAMYDRAHIPGHYSQTLTSRLRLLAAVFCLLLAQAALALHVDEPTGHGLEADCELCQAYERAAPPSAGLDTPAAPVNGRAEPVFPRPAHFPESTRTHRPPTRAPPN